MIQKRQLFFHSLSRFLLKKISANEANTSYITGSLDAQPQPGEPDVMWQSVVFIAGTGIWTNGVLFSASHGSDAAIADERLERMLADTLLQTDIQSLATQLKECQVAFFQSILPSGTLIQQSATAESTPADVYFFTDAATFGFVPSASTGVSVAQPQYCSNWPNRAIYTTADLHPYASKLYFCIQQRKLYVWDGTTLQPVGGTEIQVDDTLSPTSTNPVQNKVVTQALGTKFAAAAFVQGDLILYADTAKTVELGRVTLGATSYVLSHNCDHDTGFYVLTGETEHIVTIAPSTMSSAFGSQNTFIENYTLTVETQSGTGSFTTRIDGITIQSGRPYSFDIRPWIGTGANVLRITVTGQSSQATTSIDYALTLTSLTFSCNFSWWRAWVGGTTFGIDGLYFYGNLAKTLHVLIDDTTEFTQTFAASVNYNTTAYTFNISDRTPAWTPTTGIHTIEMWIEGGGARTSSCTYKVMVVAAADALTAKLVVINNAQATARNYNSTTSLFQFATYNTTMVTADVSATDGDQTFVIADGAGLSGLATQTVIDYPVSLAMDSYVQTDDFTLTATLTTPDHHTDSHTFPVDNSDSFAPAQGATVYFNFASRSNSEGDKQTFRNLASGGSSTYAGTFTNFAWAGDGYSTDADGNMGLKVTAGSAVAVPLLRPLVSAATGSMSLEFMFRASNIADYNSPLLSVMTTETYDAETTCGLILFPTQLKVLSSSERRHTFQSYNLSEDDIMHVVVVWHRNYAGLNQHICRFYINGCNITNFEYAGTAVWNGSYSYLRMGQASSDLMLYMMRIYDKALEPADVKDNFLNAIIENNQWSRAGLRNDNAIVDGGAISYELARQKGFNCYVVETNEELPSVNNAIKLDSVNVRLEYADHPEWNVRICDIPMDGQGTTSKQYYRWNLRNNNKSASARWEYLNLTDGQTGEMLVETGKDGYIAGYGLHPKVAKMTAKKNIASSSQGHKMGATNLYNDLWHRFFDADLGTRHYLPDTDIRVAVYQYPFLGFKMSSDGYYEFIGLYTIGPDKTDKKTFGYDRTNDYPSLMMIEGPNHAPRLTRFLCPWTSDVAYSAANETLECGGQEGWDADIAAGYSTDNTAHAAAIQTLFENEFKPAYDIIFFTSPYIRPLSATGKTIAQINADINTFWNGTTSGYNNSLLTLYDASYNLYYYRISTDQYEALGVNIVTYLQGYLSTSTPTEAQVQAACEAKFIAEISNYVNIDEALFHDAFLILIGASDNHAKNSYWRKFLALALGGRWGFNQDDLDTILPSDNNGQSTKSYSIEPGDVTANGDEIYQGASSAFWERIRISYENELRAVMVEMIGHMDSIASSLSFTAPTLHERIERVFAHYFWDSSSRYFPAIAYAEDTEFAYLTPWILDHNATYNSVEPLTQALGTQYNAELLWVQRRIAYVFSRFRIGGFGGATGEYGQLSFTPSTQNTASFALVPAIDLYPRESKGGAVPEQGARTQAGQTCVIRPSSDGATTFYLLGLHWYSYLGDLSGLVLTTRGGTSETAITFELNARRLRELKVGDAVASNVAFNATTLNVVSQALERIDARNVVSLQGTQDVTGCPRLREAYFAGTSIVLLMLPIGGKVTAVSLPATVTTLFFHSLPLLQTSGISIASYASVVSLYVNNCANINPVTLMRSCYNAGSSLKYLSMLWQGAVSGQSADVAILANIARHLYEAATGEGYGSASYDAQTGSLSNVGATPVIEGTINISSGGATRQDLALIAATWPNLTITGITQYFISFADAEILRVLLARGFGDGTGITEAQAAAVTTFGKSDDPSVSIFYANTVARTFTEFSYFTGLRTIVSGLFRGCTNLTTVVMPTNIIGEWSRTFQDCTSLTTVTLPQTLAKPTSCNYLFSGCTSLVSVTLPPAWNELGQDMFNGCSSLDMAIPGTVTRISHSAFGNSGIRAGKLVSAQDGVSIYVNCTRLTTATFFDGITAIPEWTFFGCHALNLPSLPATITTIGDYAFHDCTALSLTALPTGLTTLGVSTFRWCTALALTALPSGLTSIPDYCFDTCSASHITSLPDSITHIGVYAFWESGLSASAWPSGMATATRIEEHSFGRTDVGFSTLPPAIREVGDSAFLGCLLITNFTFPSSVITIEQAAFDHCSNLDTAALPSGLTEIADHAFDSCDLHSLSALPTGVTCIGTYAFANTKVPLASLPSGLTEIGDTAFYRVTTLRLTSLPDTLLKIGEGAFAHTAGGDPEDPSLGLTALLPPNLTHIGRDAFVGSHITKAILPDSLVECVAPFQQIGTLREIFMVHNTGGHEDVNELGGKWAYGCNSLEEVDLPSNITSIGDQAFFRESGTPIPIFRLRATTPPALGITPFVTGQVVQVPSSALEAYQTDTAWAALIDAGTITIQAIDITTITHYYLRRGLTSYGETLFDGWSSLSRVNSENEGELAIGSAVTSIAKYAIRGTSIVRVTSANATALTSVIFSNASKLKVIDLSGCTKLRTVGQNFLSALSALETIILPHGLTSVGAQAFRSSGASKCTYVRLPDTVNSIASLAFSNTSATTFNYVDFGNTRTTVPSLNNSSAFTYSGNKNIIIPDALYDNGAWAAATNWSNSTIVPKLKRYSDFKAAHPELPWRDSHGVLIDD